ncbi:hypothetical protein CXF46_07455, partial [Corynebacterium bovis]
MNHLPLHRPLRTSPRRHRVRCTLATVAAAGVLASTAPWAVAVPPGGPSPDTPGTSSSVSPRTVRPCESLSYTVRGFPAGEVLNTKIDDGIGYSDTSVQGTGVVAQQRIDSDGTVSGSLQLPCDIPPGAHWLRFLASQPVGNGGTGVKGFTLRGGGDFTVVADSGTTPGGGGTGGGAGGAGGTGTGGGAAPAPAPAPVPVPVAPNAAQPGAANRPAGARPAAAAPAARPPAAARPTGPSASGSSACPRRPPATR